MSALRQFSKLAALCATGVLSVTFPATAEVSMSADLGAEVIQSEDNGSVYLRLSLKAIKRLQEKQRAPVNIALVLDRSGSMRGDRIAAAKDAAQIALDRLSRGDVASVVAYNNKVATLQAATRLTKFSRLKDRIEELTAQGGTALYAGVVEGGRQVREFRASDKVSRVILLSDGQANIGPSSPEELGDLGRKLGAEGISVTTIGLGLQYNEDLMSKLALASDGNHAFAETPEDLIKIFNSEFGDVLSVVATDIIINIECRPGFKPKRVFGRDAKIDGNRIQLKLNQLYAAQEKYLIVELDGSPVGTTGLADIAEVDIDYLNLETKKRRGFNKKVQAEVSSDKSKAKASVNKSVMSQVATQIATERYKRAVVQRDKGDIAGARKILESNAAYLRDKAQEYSAPNLAEFEKKNRTKAGQLDAKNWAKTRKSMRHDQFKYGAQQSY